MKEFFNSHKMKTSNFFPFLNFLRPKNARIMNKAKVDKYNKVDLDKILFKISLLLKSKKNRKTRTFK